ncbi:MAG: fumarylacetoacetate hydrolase family protein [Robiginitomaculum sp.]|nr:fumarylacetoacetate hydrolase family protein [Robiginitomaculum sp.]
MGHYAFTPPPVISLPILGSNEQGSDDRFPVRRIYCVGRNYTEHVREMGGDPTRSTPMFFTKSRETIVETGTELPYPPQTTDLHYEVELVVAMAGRTEIFGYGVGLDMTRRDLQADAKNAGMPWDMAKNFDNSAPCSALVKAGNAPGINRAEIRLTNNGVTKQKSTLDKMIWSVSEIIAHLNNTVTLAAGDLIYTGTPEGVGPALAGETLIGTITGLPSIEVTYV